MTWPLAIVLCVACVCVMIPLHTYLSADWHKYWEHDARIRKLEIKAKKEGEP